MTSRRTFLCCSALGAAGLSLAAWPAVRTPNVASSKSRGRFPYYQSNPVSYLNVRMHDQFWAPRQKVIREVTVPWATRHWDTAGGLNEYRMRGNAYVARMGRDDQEAIKFLEAMSTVVGVERDPAIEGLIGAWGQIVIDGQGTDGYLMSGFQAPTLNHPTVRWHVSMQSHESYLIGHYIQAAIAHREATGQVTLYNSALRAADNMVAALLGTCHSTAGHPGVEQALTRLYGVTGNAKYLQLAGWFIRQADRRPRDYLPLEERRTIEGHAVTAAYLYNGVTEYVGATGDASYRTAVLAIWDDMAERKMYLHGATGTLSSGCEGYRSQPYVIPPDDTYGESCAIVGNIQWAHNLFRLTGDASYLDTAERMLYNAFYASLSLAGDQYFYRNLSQTFEPVRRVNWHPVPCCVANIVKLFSTVGGLFYATDQQGIFVKHYGASTAEIPFRDGVRLVQRGDYPWTGDIAIQVQPKTASEFTVRLRVPAWTTGHALTVNGRVVRSDTRQGWVEIRRYWEFGDMIELQLPMSIERISMPSQFKDYVDLVALRRGSIVYCLEEPDVSAPVWKYFVPPDAEFAADHRSDLLGGATVLQSMLPATNYYLMSEPAPTPATFIPYGLWNNRQSGSSMRIWNPTRKFSQEEILSLKPTREKVS